MLSSDQSGAGGPGSPRKPPSDSPSTPQPALDSQPPRDIQALPRPAEKHRGSHTWQKHTTALPTDSDATAGHGIEGELHLYPGLNFISSQFCMSKY